MKIHVVGPEGRTDWDAWVIARFARHLSKYNGWTLSQVPDPSAAANVFILYLDWRFHKWRKTPTTALFTHYVPSDRLRVEQWKEVAQAVDLRVTMCDQYVDALKAFGPTVSITTPVELDKFTIIPATPHDIPIIGVSGEVYPGGRKGEGLVKKLAAEQSHRWRIIASGKGWPVKTTMYQWKHLQRHYQGLDVFLCTSSIEGGPVTVLEALACGKPVVVPEHVGLIDELPVAPGIYRYPKGNYAVMVDAIEDAFADPVPPEQLRSYVADRTVERFAEEWRVAVEGMLRKPVAEIDIQEEADLPDWRKNSGVYIVAYGKRAHDCAADLIRSLHKHNPHLAICLICEGYKDGFQKSVNVEDKGYPVPMAESFKQLLRPQDMLVTAPMKDRRARNQKTNIWKFAPEAWRYILYMDADMLVTDKLDAFFAPLQDGWDMVVTQGTPPETPLVNQAQREKYKEENLYTDSVLGSSHWLQVAGGIWSFRRNERTEAFLAAFHEEWKRYSHTDQQAMMRAFWRCPVRMWTLPRQFNWFMHRGLPKSRDKAAVLHFATAARAWVEHHDGRSLWKEWRTKI